MAKSKIKIKDAISEYQYFLLYYLLPLVGISYDNNLIRIRKQPENTLESHGSFIRQTADGIVFSSYNEDVFFLRWKPALSKDCIGLAQNVIHAFFGVSKYWISDKQKTIKSIKIEYKTEAIREENYKLAIQKGVCDWCAGNVDKQSFYNLLQILEQWSVQTYEGKKVTFGFIYNPKANSSFPIDNYGTWLDFLKDDYAATLTDCIHSVIQLDKNCNFAGYLSITENNEVDAYSLSFLLPYRFARIIEKYVIGSCVGVFLLNNGDILISKNQAVQLIKRNLKWLNLSYNTFYNMAKSNLKKCTINDDLFQQIYASVLDVSFAHTGGIIAVVPDPSRLTQQTNPVLNLCDNLLDNRSLSEIEQELKSTLSKGAHKELYKRLLKRKVIISLVSSRNFSELDRKLRAELISMDGACILDCNEHICAVGAIICNDSGSSGGGRSAAAKKLSSYGGMSVKISTDGYIELFIDGDPVYAVK